MKNTVKMETAHLEMQMRTGIIIIYLSEIIYKTVACTI